MNINLKVYNNQITIKIDYYTIGIFIYTILLIFSFLNPFYLDDFTYILDFKTNIITFEYFF